MRLFYSKLLKKTMKYLSIIMSKKAIWMRGLLCLSISIVVLFIDKEEKYDFHFKVRRAQSINKDIVILNVSLDEWTSLLPHHSNQVQNYRSKLKFNRKKWIKIIKKILSQEPKLLAISLHFHELSPSQSNALSHDSRIIWGQHYDQHNILTNNPTKFVESKNPGIIDLNKDLDGTVRHFLPPTGSHAHMAIKIAQTINPLAKIPKQLEVINFRGPPGTFLSVSLNDFLYKNDSSIFKDKIVMLGSAFDIHLTPFHKMSRTEILANIANTAANNSWINKINMIFFILTLTLLSIICTWITCSYPQNYSLIFLFWMGILIISISFWTFDSLNYWISISSPIVLFISTYVVFMSYQLSLKSNLSWQLKREQTYQLESEELKNNFLSLISHDLKTPIAKMQAICNRALSEGPSIKVSEDLNKLKKENMQLHKSIETILQITRTKSNNFELLKESTDINKLAESVIEQLNDLAEDRKISIEKDLEPLFLLEVDPVLIREVIFNILENAIKYTPKGGHISIKTQEQNDELILEIVDNGHGIREEDVDHIFNKFYRSKEHDVETSGSGLGLYLAKYFIELHKGTIHLENRAQGGARVGFTLPTTYFDKPPVTSIL